MTSLEQQQQERVNIDVNAVRFDLSLNHHMNGITAVAAADPLDEWDDHPTHLHIEAFVGAVVTARDSKDPSPSATAAAVIVNPNLNINIPVMIITMRPPLIYAKQPNLMFG